MSRPPLPIGPAPAGPSEADDLIDLRGGRGAELLGFKLSVPDGQIRYGPDDAALESLRGGLLGAHESSNPPMAARSVMVGWIHSVGPSLDTARFTETAHHVLPAARSFGFREFPLEATLSALSSSHGRWNVKFLSPARERARTRASG